MLQIDGSLIVPIGAGRFHLRLPGHLDQLEQLVRRGAAQLCLPDTLLFVRVRSHMFEQNQRRHHGHFSLAGRMVVLIHIENRFKQDVQVVVVKARFCGKICADKPAHLIQAEGNQLFAAHGAQGILIPFCLVGLIVCHFSTFHIFCNGHAGDGDIQRQNGVQTFAEGNLYRAPNLSGIGTGGHHRAKGTHIIVHLTGLFPSLINGVSGFGAFLHTGFLLGSCNMPVDVGALLNDDAHTRLAAIGGLHIIADAALGCHVGDVPLHGLGVNAGGIAHIRVAVGVGVGAGNIIEKLVSILNGHDLLLLVFVAGSGAFGKPFPAFLIHCGGHLVIAQGE